MIVKYDITLFFLYQVQNKKKEKKINRRTKVKNIIVCLNSNILF